MCLRRLFECLIAQLCHFVLSLISLKFTSKVHSFVITVLILLSQKIIFL